LFAFLQLQAFTKLKSGRHQASFIQTSVAFIFYFDKSGVVGHQLSVVEKFVVYGDIWVVPEL